MKLSTRGRISKWTIDFFMYGILVLTLFPIAWMVITSLKSNNDILIGKIGFSLKSNAITSLIPAAGNVWFSTVDGFVGYYDYQSKSYKTVWDMKKESGASLAADDKGLIFVQSNGLTRLDPQTLQKQEVFKVKDIPWKMIQSVKKTSLVHYENHYYLGQVMVKSEADDEKSYAQKKSFEGLVILDDQFKPVKTLTVDNYLLSSTIYSLVPGFDHDLWIATDEGLNVLDTNTNEITAYYTQEEGLFDNKVINVVVEKDVAYIATSAGVSMLDRATDKIVPLPLSSELPLVTSLVKKDSLLFVGTVNGLFTFDLKSGQTTAYYHDESTFWDVQRIMPTKEGAWVGLSDGTVSHLSFSGGKLVQSNEVYKVRDGSFDIRWENYIDMWENISFGTYLKNSLIICGITVVLALFLATLAGYALARFQFPGSSFFSSSILATQMIPMLMFLIPIYLMFIKFHEITGIRLVGTYPGIIFVYATFFVPMSIWILRSFFVSIPVEIEEAARIDGCSRFGVFWRIALPLAAPGIIATGIYIFLIAWDELMFATILLPQQDMLTIPLGIKLYIGNHQNRFDLMMAASTVATLPVLIMFFAVQKWFIKGLTAGAVKG